MLTINEVEKDWVAAIGTSDINERKNIAERWNAYYGWLGEKGLTETPIEENTGFTNEYLP